MTIGASRALVFSSMLIGAISFSLVAGVMFVALAGLQLLGRLVGLRRVSVNPGGFFEGHAVVEGSLFALLGLLVAFTFSGAQTRLDTRRALIVQEANAIGTAFKRLDLLPVEAQPMIKDEFRRYVDARMAFYRDLDHLHLGLRRADHERAVSLQDQIWHDVVDATRDGPDARATLLLVPALNEMIDLTAVRDVALRTHTPLLIFVLLALLGLSCAFFAGLSMARSQRQSHLHVLVFAGVLALTAYVILDLEFPRFGLVRLSAVDALLGEVRASMGAG